MSDLIPPNFEIWLLHQAEALGVRTLLGAAATRLLATINPNDENLRTVIENHRREAVARGLLHLHKVEEDARAKGQENKVAELAGEVEGVWRFVTYMREADRSATTERLDMLAAAFAGTCAPEGAKDDQSRAFRIAVQLEPSDVVWLRRYRFEEGPRVGDPSPVNRNYHEEQKRLGLIGAAPMSADMLVSLGCLRIGPPGVALPSDTYHSPSVPSVTELGMAVLRLLQTFPYKR